MITKGYLILAQNTDTINYINCAIICATSIKINQPNANITLLTDTKINHPIFDNIIQLPFGDTCPNSNWKLSNDWQIYTASPYDETIKIEADMWIPRSIEHWWDMFKYRDLQLCTTIRNFKNEISTNYTYRNTIIKNKLPNIYNALTYFKKSNLASDFYNLVQDIFQNWEEYTSDLILQKNEVATTDIVYSIAAHIIGEQHCTVPQFLPMSMIHMKPAINETRSANWTKELLCEIHHHTLRVNTFAQLYPFHYHIKEFASTIAKELNINLHYDTTI